MHHVHTYAPYAPCTSAHFSPLVCPVSLLPCSPVANSERETEREGEKRRRKRREKKEKKGREKREEKRKEERERKRERRWCLVLHRWALGFSSWSLCLFQPWNGTGQQQSSLKRNRQIHGGVSRLLDQTEPATFTLYLLLTRTKIIHLGERVNKTKST